jgi:hypothetical protein
MHFALQLLSTTSGIIKREDIPKRARIGAVNNPDRVVAPIKVNGFKLI